MFFKSFHIILFFTIGFSGIFSAEKNEYTLIKNLNRIPLLYNPTEQIGFNNDNTCACFKAVQESFLIKKNKSSYQAVNYKILENQQNDLQITKIYYISFFVILFSLLLFGIIYYIKLQNLQKKLDKKQMLIEQDIQKIDLLKDELTSLKSQKLDLLIDSARKNDPLFLAKFNEIYPHFTPSLKKMSEKLTYNDLKFCALVKLNFHTKEIADILFVTIKAIEVKRYRIQKKINLDYKINFEIWIQSL